jgi:hypothetical protein
MSEEEIRKRKEKHGTNLLNTLSTTSNLVVLFLRHKLQKGLCSRDNPPKSDDMPNMNDHLTALENFQDLESPIIRETKVAKLLKVILKLTDLPRDEEFKFKDRCGKLLAGWNAILAADDVKRDPEPNTNGVATEAKEDGNAEATSVDAKEPIINGSATSVVVPEKKSESEATPAAEPNKETVEATV